jgi:hypothetical protein
VLVEPGATIDCLDAHRFSQADIVVYASSYLPEQRAGLRIAFGSYRDKVPDHRTTALTFWDRNLPVPVACIAAEGGWIAVLCLAGGSRCRWRPARAVAHLLQTRHTVK